MNMLRGFLIAVFMFGAYGIGVMGDHSALAADGVEAVAAEGRASIKVKGMHCEECNSAIVGQVKKVEGV